MMRAGTWPMALALPLLAWLGLTATALPLPRLTPPATRQVPQLLFLGEKRPLRFRLDVRFRASPSSRPGRTTWPGSSTTPT